MLRAVPTWEDVLLILERLDARVTALEQQLAPPAETGDTVRVSGVPYAVPRVSVQLSGSEGD